MWDFVLVSVLKLTTPKTRHGVIHKGIGNLRTTAPKWYVKENIYFACFPEGYPE
jgi:hypothetical protein